MKMKITVLLIVSVAILISGCRKNEDTPILDIKSLYSPDDDIFSLNGYSTETNWREVAQDFGIDDKKIIGVNGKYSTADDKLYIFETPSSYHGYIEGEKVLINNEIAKSRYDFENGKLDSVIFKVLTNKRTNEEMLDVANMLKRECEEAFEGLPYYEEALVFSVLEYGECYWFSGDKNGMSFLCLSTNTDSWDAEAILELYISVDNELAYERYSELILQTTVE